MVKVESFQMDHTKVKAPFVRKCGLYPGKSGDTVSKFDLRFIQPNQGVMETSGIHTMEHLLAGYMREKLEDIIDISPMGCRTGFYMVAWGDLTEDSVADALEYALKMVIETEEIPAANELQCGNYRDHSLELAKSYAREVLEKGLRSGFYV
jgi:S-ribosylhomocysteine lyase